MDKRQCKMGRAALEWNAKRLADEAGLGTATVARFELGETVAADTIVKLQSAMEAAGVQFSRKGTFLVVAVPN